MVRLLQTNAWISQGVADVGQDQILQPLSSARERSYSEPLSAVAFRKETFERDGVSVRDYPRLKFGGKHLGNPEVQLSADVSQRTLIALGGGACFV